MDHEPTEEMDQFQKAALDAVRAARALLDAAESLIKDPAAIESMVQTVTHLARSAGETVVGFAAGARDAVAEDGTPSGDDPDGGPDRGYERIHVD
ncbi:MAG: hypothetical protein ACSLFO_14890 [Acidimicrobiales bacterium]